jgi:hypothetical protein
MFLATTILIADSQRKEAVEKYLDDLSIASKIIDPEIAID